jgi:hypothetical protein
MPDERVQNRPRASPKGRTHSNSAGWVRHEQAGFVLEGVRLAEAGVAPPSRSPVLARAGSEGCESRIGGPASRDNRRVPAA